MNKSMYPIYHEIGHYIVANEIGYEGFLTGSLKNNNNFKFVQTTSVAENIIGLKNQILICFGGLGAEKILSIPINPGHIGDMKIAFDFLRKLYNLENRIFNFKEFYDFPKEEFDNYLNNSIEILNEYGGSNYLLELGNEFYNYLKNHEGN